MLLSIFSGITVSADSNQLIIINKAKNELAFFENGQLNRVFQVGTGRTQNLTPEGNFMIVNKIKNRPYYTGGIRGGDPANPLGDRWLGLNARDTWGTTYAIHGNNNPNSIGSYVSAGCVRMHNHEVSWLFDRVQLYTPVIIVNSNRSFSQLALANGYRLNETNFFQVNRETPVFDNKTGRLVEVGRLKTGEVYPIVSDFGNWHRIQFAGDYGFVRKSDTTSVDKNNLKNINRNYKNSNRAFTSLVDATVYDNTSGTLVPFAKIGKGVQYPIVSDYGPNWYRVLVSNRVGYVRKSHTDFEGRFFKALNTIPVFSNETGRLVEVGQLNKGQVYPIVGDYGNWHRIQFAGKYGFVRKSSTIPAGGNVLMIIALELYRPCHVFGPLLTNNCSTSAMQRSTLLYN